MAGGGGKGRRHDAGLEATDLAPTTPPPAGDAVVTGETGLATDETGVATFDPGKGDTVDADAASASPSPAPAPRVRARAPVDDALKPGETIDHFVTISRLGAGGMGVVYLAFDPELDRKVAIKLLKVKQGGGSAGQTRLQREAQAMAQLSHPNVIQVYQVGRHKDDVFVAMEYVEGRSLAEWLRVEPRPWRMALEVFLQAAEGLAAAHRAGLVHRDFKPENVLVGKDGRVRVLDFGLARALEPSAETIAELPLGASSTSGALHMQLTAEGAVVGTPAYMAPEQHEGVATDPRTDQFSFCVALWEALYGQRPFAGDTYVELRRNVLAGRLREPPEGAKVPRWIRPILVRGLSVDPATRFPSMELVAAALSRGVAQRRRLPIVVALGAALAGAGLSIALVGRHGALPRPCAGAEARLAGVWDLARRQAVQHGLAASGSPLAADTWPRVEKELDAYAGRWVAGYTEACEATRVTRTQSEELLDRRVACLEQKRQELVAVTDALAHVDAESVPRAMGAVRQLGAVDECADVKGLLAIVPLPTDPSLKARVVSGRERLARARADYVFGHYDAAFSSMTGIAAEARAIGFKPFEAEALYRKGLVQIRVRDMAAAAATLEDAFRVAEEAGYDGLRSQVAVELAEVVGFELNRPVDGHAWVGRAKALLTRVGGDPELASDLAVNEGLIALGEGKYDEALAHYHEALAEREKRLGADSYEVGQLLSNIAMVEASSGHNDDALADLDKAEPVIGKALGQDHPMLADVLLNRGAVLIALDRYQDARAPLERALAITERVFGAQSPKVAGVLENLGIVADETGRPVDANTYYRRAREIYAQDADANALQLTRVLVNLAVLHARLGRFAEARGEAEEARDRRAKLVGEDHAQMAIVWYTLGDVANGEQRWDDAIAAYRRAIAIYEAGEGKDGGDVSDTLVALASAERGAKRYGDAQRDLERALEIRVAESPDAPEAYLALAGLGEVKLDQHDARGALPVFERAWALSEKADLDPPSRAPVAFGLARALWDGGGDRSWARALAKQALDGFTAGGAEVERKRVATWVAAHAY